MRAECRGRAAQELDAALLDRAWWMRRRAELETTEAKLRADAANLLTAEYVRLLGAVSLETRRKMLLRLIDERNARRIAAMLE